MKRRPSLATFVVIATSVVMLGAMVGCGDDDSPTTPTVTPTPTPTPAPVTLTAPVADSPTNLIQLDTLRPRLTVVNVTSNTTGTRSYEFQVADNSDFTIVEPAGLGDEPFVVAYTKAGVSEDGSGKTSLDVDQDLQPNKTYYWRARATQGSVTSSWSEAATFKSKVRVPILSKPTNQGPVDSAQLDNVRPTLTVANSTSDMEGAKTYEFQVSDTVNFAAILGGGDAEGTLAIRFTKTDVAEGSGGTTSVTLTSNLAESTTYWWRARAKQLGQNSSWSTATQFTTKMAGGYIRGSEVWDPLISGTTVGQAHDVSFVAGKGVRLNSKDSYVNYRIATLTEGEFSFEAENIGNGSEDYKTKILSMQDCCGDLTENPYRVTVDKRSSAYTWNSHIRFRIISHGDYSDAVGGGQNWDRSKTYLWEFAWRAGVARLRVWLGGRNGTLIEDLDTTYQEPYNPSDHLARLGSVGGRGGNESLPGVIIRYVWISGNPRPASLGVGVTEP